MDGDCDVVVTFWPIFRTVFIEAELFNDDRELRKLVRDPLRSTSCLLDDIGPISLLRRSEFVRFGIMLVRECGVTFVEAARNDRLRSKLCRFRSINDFTTNLDFGGFGLCADVEMCDCSPGSLHDDVLSLPSDTKL